MADETLDQRLATIEAAIMGLQHLMKRQIDQFGEIIELQRRLLEHVETLDELKREDLDLQRRLIESVEDLDRRVERRERRGEG